MVAAVAVLLVPAGAGAADKTSTLPDQQLWPTAAYDLTVGWLIGTVQDVTFTDARVKPPTTTDEVAILNDLIAELQSP
jgi:hypothetical protein